MMPMPFVYYEKRYKKKYVEKIGREKKLNNI